MGHLRCRRYLAGVDDGFQLQCRQGAFVSHGAGQGKAVGDVRWGDAGQGARLNHQVRMVLPNLGYMTREHRSVEVFAPRGTSRAQGTAEFS